MMSSFEQYLHTVVKWVLHILTGKSEMERLCGKGMHNAEMSLSVGISLYRSKRLSTYRTLVFNFKKFSTQAAVSNVLQVKRIKREPLVVANLTHCFDDLGHVNEVIRGLEKLAATSFAQDNASHGEMLTEFWQALLPDSRTPSFTEQGSKDWGLVGFQGKLPQTDFRGMGLLGLKQLHFFATKRTIRARQCLKEANHEKRYFPFAATGINITAFLLELIRETRLHSQLLEHTDANFNKEGGDNEKDKSGDTEPLLGGGGAGDSSDTWRDGGYGSEDEVHMTYCDLYSAFVTLWAKRNPSDIMAFPGIMAEFKDAVRRNPALAAISSF